MPWKSLLATTLSAAFFYLDPPYIDTNQGHYKGYLREHYEQLLRLLAGLKGKFMLSYFPNEPLQAAVEQYSWEMRVFDKAKSVSGKAGDRKQEVLTLNYVPPEGAAESVS